MKSFYSSLALLFFSAGLAIAQPRPADRTTTPPATTTVVSNRQQELYDQYHGITKKPATSVPVTTPTSTANGTNSVEPAKSVSNAPAQPAETGTPTQAMNRETMTRPERIAADGTSSGFRLGARGGVTYPVYTEKLAGVDAAVGFTGGVVMNFGKGTISFQPEINYTRYNQKVKDPFSTYVYTIATDIVEVPLFLKIASGTYAGNRFFVNIGPYASYWASQSTDGKKVDISNTAGRFGFGAAAGIGAALKAGPGHVTVEVRGLYPLGDTESGFNTVASKTILGQGALGYIFPL